MALENKLGITDSAELARVEEKISKTKAVALFENKVLDTFEVRNFKGLSSIHKFLFDEIYDFAGTVRTVNIAKGNFRFAPVTVRLEQNFNTLLLELFGLQAAKLAGAGLDHAGHAGRGAVELFGQFAGLALFGQAVQFLGKHA